MANIREFLYDNQNKIVDITSLLHLLEHKHELACINGSEDKTANGEIVLLRQTIKELDNMHNDIEILLKSTKEV